MSQNLAHVPVHPNALALLINVASEKMLAISRTGFGIHEIAEDIGWSPEDVDEGMRGIPRAIAAIAEHRTFAQFQGRAAGFKTMQDVFLAEILAALSDPIDAVFEAERLALND